MSNGKRGISKAVNSAVSAAALRVCWDPTSGVVLGMALRCYPQLWGKKGQEKPLHACR